MNFVQILYLKYNSFSLLTVFFKVNYVIVHLKINIAKYHVNYLLSYVSIKTLEPRVFIITSSNILLLQFCCFETSDVRLNIR